MKAIKLLLALISFTSLSISANMDALDFSQDNFCPKSPKAQLRGGLFYLPNNTEPYSGEALCSYLTNGQHSLRGRIKNGLPVGEWLEWDVNGQIRSKKNFLNGSLNGPFTNWGRNGQINTKGFFKDGRRHGVFIEYYESGKILSEGKYIKDYRAGEWKFWYESGQLKSKGFFKEGQRHGLFVEYYDSGQITSKGKWNDSARTGEWKFWYENGQLESKGFYKHNQPDGFFVKYYDSGQISALEEWKTGDRLGKWDIWYSNGQMHELHIFRKGIEGSENWYLNEESLEVFQKDIASYLSLAKQLGNEANEEFLKTQSQLENEIRVIEKLKAELAGRVANENMPINLLPGQGLLLIDFIDDCWVEIQDGNGNMVLTELMTEGQNIKMAVQAPVQLFLGRASAVTNLQFAQRSVDLKPHTRKDIARVDLEL